MKGILRRARISWRELQHRYGRRAYSQEGEDLILDRFFEGRYQLWSLQVGVAPEFETLHSNPRFKALLRRLGLTPTR